MSTISYPQTVTQTTGGKYATFDSLANIKNNATGKYAVTKRIKGKSESPNHPSTVSCTNFKLNLPTGARVTSVKVEYRHDLQPYNSKYPSINAPTISLLGVSGYSTKGKAPNKSLTTRSVTFKPKKSTDFSSAKLNSNGFGFKIDYPKNANANSGYLRISFVRITVNYKTPSFTLAYSANPKMPEQNGKVNVSLKASNKNLTDYTPTITITTPAGFTLKNTPTMQNGSTWTKVNNRTYLWKPKFTSKIGSMTLGLSFDVNVSGTLPVSATFEAVESLTGATGVLTVNVVEATPDSTSEDDEDSQKEMDADEQNPISTTHPKMIVKNGETIIVDLHTTRESMWSGAPEGTGMVMAVDGTSEYTMENIEVASDEEFTHIYSPLSPYYLAIPYEDFTDGYLQVYVRINKMGSGAFIFFMDYVGTWLSRYRVEVTPLESELSTCFLTLLRLSGEEVNRLGDGYPYTVQSDMKLTTNEEYVRDWYKNFRLGVFNNPIEENVTRTLDYWTTDETTNTTINIPISIDVEEHNSVDITASDLILTIDETDYTFNSEETKTIPITTNSFIAVATKNTSDTASYTVEIEDYTKTYNINFNAEENKTEEVIHDTTDYDTLTNEQIFNNAEYWSSTIAGLNTSNNVTTDFTYEEDYPLYILITGDYPEGDPYNNTVTYNEPCIIETDDASQISSSMQYASNSYMLSVGWSTSFAVGHAS